MSQLFKILNNFDVLSDQACFYIKNKNYTYGQFSKLLSRIQKLIHFYNDEVFGILMHDDIRVYASIVAVLLQNKGYVIINPKNPIERNNSIIEQSGLLHILCFFESDISLATQFGANLIFVSDLSDDESDKLTEPGIFHWDENKTAYILFTSGSTGIPKGVKITHKNLASFFESFFKLDISITDSDKVLQMFDLTFDVSVAMLLCPLIKGACIYTTPFDKVKYIEIAKILNKYSISVLCLVPSVLSYLKPYFAELKFESVKECILTAEASHYDLINDWKRCVPHSQIWNLYGPTEATIWCLAYKFDENAENEIYNGMIAIGKEMYSVGSLVIDEQDKIISVINEKGELLISGEQVTYGYINDADKNLSAFVNIEVDGNKQRYYKTGDVVYKNEFGNLMYCGRLDHQVKVQGYRIELNEIEYYARMHSKTSNAICFISGNDSQELILIIEQMIGSESEIISELKIKLPAYMVPRKVISINAFPVNASNKIDRPSIRNNYLDGIK